MIELIILFHLYRITELIVPLLQYIKFKESIANDEQN